MTIEGAVQHLMESGLSFGVASRLTFSLCGFYTLSFCFVTLPESRVRAEQSEHSETEKQACSMMNVETRKWYRQYNFKKIMTITKLTIIHYVIVLLHLFHTIYHDDHRRKKILLNQVSI